MNFFLDAIIVATLVLTFIIGWKRGFVAVAVELVGTIAAVIVSCNLGAKIAEWIYEAFLRQPFAARITAVIGEKNPGLQEFQSLLDSFPSFLVRALSSRNIDAASLHEMTRKAGEDVAVQVADGLSPVFVTVIRFFTVIVLFLLCMLLVKLVAKLLDGVCKIPVLKELNGSAGGVLGLCKGIIFVWLGCAALQLLIPALAADRQLFWENAIHNSFLFDVIFLHNPLDLLLK